jgi:hypothetical protein
MIVTVVHLGTSDYASLKVQKQTHLLIIDGDMVAPVAMIVSVTVPVIVAM